MFVPGSGNARFLVILALLLSAGCALSTSSRSVSDSSDSSESSSRSSTSKERQGRYREDVRTYTAVYLKSGGHVDAFEKQLGELARRYGVTDWESDEATYVGMGEGFSDAGVGPTELETYKIQFARLDPLKIQAIQTGYDTRH